MNRFIFILIGLVTLINIPMAQGAGFTGDYAPSNWITTIFPGGDGSVTPSGTTSVQITGNNNGANIGNQSINSYTITANQSGKVNFNWAYQSNDSDGPAFDKFVFLKNGVATTISNDGGSNSQNGSQSILISKNDVFGFAIDATDALWGGGFVTVSDFLFQLFGPSAIDTLDSMRRNASSMRGFFSMQASYVNPGLSYDCSLFNDNDLCFSTTARNTNVGGSDIDSTSGVITAAYRVNSNVRVGGFVEQMTSNIKDGGVRLDNNAPDYGIFGVWQQNEDGVGLKARAAYRYGKKDLSIARQALGTAEAGYGKSDLSTQGVQITLSNGFRVHDQVLISPYAGIRYIKIKRDGYTEELTNAVTAPLTYDNLRQETTSALLGANLSIQLTPQVITSGSLGIEYDVGRKIDSYSATGVDNLDSIQFDRDAKRTRAVASFGLGYRIKQAQQVSAQVVYREEAYGEKSTTTAMLTYTAGF